MKLRKTHMTQRTTYTYEFTEMAENGEYITRTETLRPGENGVTELDIRLLHNLDDREVNNNIKNLRPKTTDAKKAERAAWIERYKADFLAKYGYIPTADDIRYAISERYPKNWALPLNLFDVDEGNGDTHDCHSELTDTTAVLAPDETLPAGIQRVREIVATCTEKQQEAYRLVYIEGFSQKEVARITGCSAPAITQRLNCVIEKIKNNF